MPRWTSVSKDPNSREAADMRSRHLAAAFRRPIRDRVAYLAALAAGKRVLDVGVVNHVLRTDSPEWLHGAIVKSASYCLGVDILPEPVEELKRAGFNVRLCDITHDTIDEKFDLMIVGEVIEHLTDPGALFRAAVRQLSPGGRLVMTTPNPHYIRRVRDAVLGHQNDSVDHVTFLYPGGIAEMAERAGMTLDIFRGFEVAHAQGPMGKFLLHARGAFESCGISPTIFCNSIAYECVVDSAGSNNGA